MNFRPSLAALCVAACATALSAQTVLFSENFESTTGSSLPAGWTAFANGGTVQTAANPYTGGANSSSRVLSLAGPNANGGVGFVVSFNYVAAPAVDVSAYFTGTGAGATALADVSISLAVSGTHSANFGQLMAVGFADGTGTVYEWHAAYSNWTNQSFNVTNLGTNSTAGTWWSVTLSDLEDYLPGTGFDPSNLRIVFAHIDGANGLYNYTTNYVDNVALTAAIPEPSTYAALAGLLAMGLVVWRRRATAGVR